MTGPGYAASTFTDTPKSASLRSISRDVNSSVSAPTVSAAAGASSRSDNGGSGESYAHEGEEFLHVLRGEFEIWLGSKEHHVLKTGDSLYFDSSTPHRWRNPGRTETQLLWINTPPTF